MTKITGTVTTANGTLVTIETTFANKYDVMHNLVEDRRFVMHTCFANGKEIPMSHMTPETKVMVFAVREAQETEIKGSTFDPKAYNKITAEYNALVAKSEEH